MHCKHCGKELPDQAGFCQKCGNPVQAAAAPLAPSPSKRRTWWKWGLAIFAALLLIGIFAPQEDREGQQQTRESTADRTSQAPTESVTEQATAATPPPETTAPHEPQKSDLELLKSAGVVNEISKYLSENFGAPGYETSWYPSIKQIMVEGDTVIAETDLPNANAKARGVCVGVSGFVWSNTNRHLGLKNVRVTGSGNRTLIHRVGLSGKCQ